MFDTICEALEKRDYNFYDVDISLDGISDEQFNDINLSEETFQEIISKVIYFFSKSEHIYLTHIYIYELEQTDDDGYIYEIKAEVEDKDDVIRDLRIYNIDLERFGGKVRYEEVEKEEPKPVIKESITFEHFCNAVNYYLNE